MSILFKTRGVPPSMCSGTATRTSTPRPSGRRSGRGLGAPPSPWPVIAKHLCGSVYFIYRCWFPESFLQCYSFVFFRPKWIYTTPTDTFPQATHKFDVTFHRPIVEATDRPVSEAVAGEEGTDITAAIQHWLSTPGHPLVTIEVGQANPHNPSARSSLGYETFLPAAGGGGYIGRVYWVPWRLEKNLKSFLVIVWAAPILGGCQPNIPLIKII